MKKFRLNYRVSELFISLSNLITKEWKYVYMRDKAVLSPFELYRTQLDRRILE